MRLGPLQEWICDDCGQIIHSVEEGWLEWKCDNVDMLNYGYRIVHHKAYSPNDDGPRGRGCYYSESKGYPGGCIKDMHLDCYTGVDGLMALLNDIVWYPQKNTAELCEIIRRLHVPHWESARQYIAQAYADGFVERSPDDMTYSQETIVAILERYDREQGRTDKK